MDNEIQLISDGDGLAVIGDPMDVERFLISQGLDQLPSRDLGLPRLGKVLSNGAVATQTGSAIATGSGRWVQITEESAALIDKFTLMTCSDNGLDLGAALAHRPSIKRPTHFVPSIPTATVSTTSPGLRQPRALRPPP